jgi:hypothetical protein
MIRRSPPPLSLAVLAVAGLAAGCGASAIPSVDPAQTAQPVQVERVEKAPPRAEAESNRLGLQILVASESASFLDRRRLKLGRGSLRVSVRGVPADLDPSTVSVRTLTPSAQLALVEARFFSGMLTPAQLLAPYVGKEVVAYLRDDTPRGEHAEPAILVGFADNLPIVSIDKQIRVLEADRVAVPRLPDSLREEPTLELLVTSDRDEQDVELAYRSHQVDAGMVYQLVRPPGSPTAELTGLVGVSKETSTPLVDAALLIATEGHDPVEFGLGDDTAKPGGGDPTPAEPPTTRMRLPSPLTLGAGQRALVHVFGPTEVTLARKVVIEGLGFPSYATALEEYGNTSIRAVLDASARSGEPLARAGLVGGQAHLFERAAAEPPRAYGMVAARPLPGTKGVRVDLGAESKYPARRRLLARRDLGKCVVETTWEVAISNPTENPLPVEDVETVSGKYQVLESSVPVLAAEPDHFVFGLTVPAGSEIKVKFRVRTSACIVARRSYWRQEWSKKPSWSGAK